MYCPFFKNLNPQILNPRKKVTRLAAAPTTAAILHIFVRTLCPQWKKRGERWPARVCKQQKAVLARSQPQIIDFFLIFLKVSCPVSKFLLRKYIKGYCICLKLVLSRCETRYFILLVQFNDVSHLLLSDNTHRIRMLRSARWLYCRISQRIPS